MRVKHWIKNLLIFAAPFFAGTVFDTFSLSIPVFICFCLFSSAGYLINDIKDLDYDKKHNPTRLLASRQLNKNQTIILVSILFAGGAWCLLFVQVVTAIACIGYLVLSGIYSLFLKRIPILDIVAISLLFVLRVVAGALETQTPLSWWFILYVFMLSALFAASKRLNNRTRFYTDSKLKKFVVRLSVSSLCIYILYAFIHKQAMLWTVPTICLITYAYVKNVLESEIVDPLKILYSDKPLQLFTLAFIVQSYFIIY